MGGASVWRTSQHRSPTLPLANSHVYSSEDIFFHANAWDAHCCREGTSLLLWLVVVAGTGDSVATRAVATLASCLHTSPAQTHR